MNENLKNKINRHRKYVYTSLLSICAGTIIAVTPTLWPNPQVPSIYEEFYSTQYQVLQLENTRKRLCNILSIEESAFPKIEESIGEAIDARQKRITEIKQVPEFQRYQEDARRFRQKKDIPFYIGMAINLLGCGAFLGYVYRSEKIRKEYEKAK